MEHVPARDAVAKPFRRTEDVEHRDAFVIDFSVQLMRTRQAAI
jgi:hypothetical protein